MNYEFAELLKPNVKRADTAVIEALRSYSHVPVILYGATVDVAGRIAVKLQRHGIRIDRIAFDGDCPAVDTSAPALSGVEVDSVENIDRDFRTYHVIIGFVKGYGRQAEVARKFTHARGVGYLSEIFDMEEIPPSFVRKNRDVLKALYESLSDPLSKDSFVAYLMSKIHQDMCYLPPVFDKHQYFPAGLFNLTDQESYFDCGAYTGDTLADFLQATRGAYRHIWVAEPDPSNYRQLTGYIRERQLSGVEAINKGIYGFTGRLPFQAEGSMLSMITEDSSNYIEVDTIDHIVAGRPVTYIKMDVEGAEWMALQGAENTIRANRPILGISIYHKKQDLIDIPVYLKTLAPEYAFYFRVHKKLAIDTVLYAVAR
ncbi:MAG: FkbM family methyltransferase [Tannerella sp.]|jgi:FkbM family methyltransferase|nr:FkbM family methyltransferase [Tannerella sp.]